MTKPKANANKAAPPFDENPEWTLEDLARARPALEVIGEVFGAPTAEALKRGRGRPEKPDRKVNQTLRLDADVLAAYRDQGVGWQTRINQILRENMPDQRK